MREHRSAIILTLLALAIIVYVRFGLGVAFFDVIDEHLPSLV